MSEPIIRVENLGKKYLIRHQQQEPYAALRDVITNGVKSLGRTLVKGGVQKLESPSREDFWALKDVSFEINRGDRVGIIGRNGAGKSTLLKILSRITEPTTGRINIKGRVASLLEVGTGFHPELTGRENIYLNGAILGMSKVEIKKKFDEIVAFAEVEKFLDTPVKRYSSGMYVRLAFSVAAHLEPEILIVDEVLAVGDLQFQEKCLGKMEDVAQKEGRTVIFVSHNMAAISGLCTSALHLSSGQVIGKGSVGNNIERYMMLYQDKMEINENNRVKLGKNLFLKQLSCSPNPVVSGSELEIKLVFEAVELTQIEEVAVLIYSCLGTRVAILDLRQPDTKYIVSEINQTTIKIKSFYLIEGSYRMGLYIRADEIYKDFLDLLTINVRACDINKIVPYPKEVRGFVKLDFKIVK
ncbi:ABC transporter ATP-binding protein [Roseofilum capinflatum]|uniref:ABC transporter ATP-binding protein n=1 Tax=Roseofilum capinflatum BLCC-M114 TaxID=3022440 RepID=A0ABT7B8A4_9CYAN|nr:ABC transporter ATP-binding protein [Roseofilum capinflatum]MDJ1175407.1 ABC transporter ATP-binding protein [Roseofilum capinflatum BLCC-M114]